MKRRNLILLLGGASSGTMSVGTGAFSSMEAERGVEVSVVGDDSAYVGYNEWDKTVPEDLRDDGTVHLVTVTNRFREAISIVDAVIGNGTDVLSEVSYDDAEFGTGEKAEITGRVEGLTPGERVEVEVTVTVEGAGVTAQLFGDTETRRFTIEREDRDVALESVEVEFFGGGNAEILGDDRDETVDIYRLVSNKGTNSIEVDNGVEVATEQKLRGQLSGAGGDAIVGVALGDTTHIHPQWDSENCDLSHPNNGGFGIPSDDPPSCDDSE
ncbi:hypothetical protein [Halorubrum sp. DTA46]|uniref:hypothetical protein n=1 Tax=Halorubrum sp. DTA46 TaxID=3402162 RepID=UPI003AAFCF9C